MLPSRARAQKLLTAAELELFDATRRDQITALTAVQARAKVARARRVRDKDRDLLRRQRLATRARTGAKLGPRASANLRTEEKAALFETLRERFEARLDAIAAAEKAAARRAASAAASASKSARAAKSRVRPSAPKARAVVRKTVGKQASAPTRAGFVSAAAKAAAVKSRFVSAGAVRIQAHVRAQGRRKQARRDNR